MFATVKLWRFAAFALAWQSRTIDNGMLVSETADGHRFEIRIEADGTATVLREL